MPSAPEAFHERSLSMRSMTRLVLAAALPLTLLAGCGEEAVEEVAR